MKIILCLVALVLFGIASASHHDHPITETTSDFFQGTWYPVNFYATSVKNKKCCLPLENIRFDKDRSKHLHLTATKWVGGSCTGSYDEVEPFSKASADISFARLSPMLVSSYNGVQIDVKEANLDSIHYSNHTQQVTFELTLSYKFSGGEKCSMTLSKADTPYIKHESSLRTVSSPFLYNKEQETTDDYEVIKTLFSKYLRRAAEKDIFWD